MKIGQKVDGTCRKVCAKNEEDWTSVCCSVGRLKRGAHNLLTGKIYKGLLN